MPHKLDNSPIPPLCCPNLLKVAIVLWMETDGESAPEGTPSEGKIMGYSH